MALQALVLLPRDGFFCKDGRDWLISESGRGHGLSWPLPSTLLGALRSAWGRGLEDRRGRPLVGEEWRQATAAIGLGRTLALRRPLGGGWSHEERVWPVLSDAVWLEGRPEVQRLLPAPRAVPTLGQDDDEAREAMWVAAPDRSGKPLPSPRWWSEALFTAWLAGKPVAARAPGELQGPARRLQTHVGIAPATGTAIESVLFAHDVVETLEPKHEWAIGVEMALPAGALPELARLGSDGRLADVEALPAGIFDPPDSVLQAFRAGSRGARLALVGPACFEQGWLPDGFERRAGEIRGFLPGMDGELVLRAAMVPRPLPISGWDMAAGRPKPVVRAVAPGSVYFVERTDGSGFGESDARALWLAAIGGRTEEGFGRLVAGPWDPGRS
jgi:CRISPR-associated protein Cmr3